MRPTPLSRVGAARFAGGAAILSLLLSGAPGPLSAQVTAVGHDSGKPILPDWVGLNNQVANSPSPWGGMTTSPSSAHLARRQALAASRTGTLRYPGGTVSTYWDFVNGRLFRPVTAINISSGVPLEWTQLKYTISWVATTNGQSNTIHDFMGAYTAMAAEPEGPMGVVFVLNLTTPGVDYYSLAGLPALPAMNGRPARPARPGPLTLDQTPASADWWAMMDARFLRNLGMLEEAEARGIPVRYVELGNELFFNPGSAGTSSGATLEPYSAGASGDNDMWGAFPDRDTAWDEDTLPDRGRAYAVVVNDWAQMLLARFPSVRLCAVGSDANSTASNRRNDWNRDVVAQIDRTLVPAVSYHIYGKVSGTITGTEAQLGAALASFRTAWAEARESSRMPEDREVWITEWNNNQSIGSWSNGFVGVFQLLHWLHEESIGLTNYHQFAQGVIAGSFGSPTGITAAGRALSTLSYAAKGRTRAWPVLLDGAPPLDGQPSLPALQVWGFGNFGSSSVRYLVANFSGTTRDVDVSALQPSGNFRRAHAPLGTSTADPGESTGAATAQLSLPPYSLTVFDGSAAAEWDWASWRAAKQLPADASPEADPDGDGLPNLVEYALDLDPLTATAPGSAHEIAEADGHLTLTFRRDSGRTDLAYLVEASSDLTNWTTLYDSRVHLQANNDGLRMRIADPLPLDGSTPTRFLRLQVVRVTSP